jgi:tetratricopeptide (TPR) repeat protein
VISVKLYDKGHDIYSKYRYDEALEIFLLSNSYDPTNVNTIYFIGRSYHRLEDYDNARLYYEKVVEEFPGTKRHDSAKTYLNRLPD